MAQNSTELRQVDNVCISRIAKEYSSAFQGNNYTVARQVIASVLACAGIETVQRPLRLLSPLESTATINQMVDTYKSMSGLTVIVDRVDTDAIAQVALDMVSYGRKYYDGWLMDPAAMVNLAQQGMLEPLDQYVAGDPEIAWMDVERFFRATSSVYGGQVVGIPILGKTPVLYYRKDVFEAANLSAPNTWDEMIYLARKLNGSDFDNDGQPDCATCFQVFDGCIEDHTLFQQILAPYTQTQGLAHGWLFDPDRMKPLVDNKAFLKALSNFNDLLSVMWPVDRRAFLLAENASACQFFNYRFLEGKCAMTIKWDEQFKGIQLLDKIMPNMTTNPWKGGVIGYVPLPGTDVVLDRDTGELVQCTQRLCPYATSHYSPVLNRTLLINRAPSSGLAGFAGMVNSNIEPLAKQAMYLFYRIMSQFSFSFPLVIGLTAIGPFRTRHFDTSPASLAQWEAAGYDRGDVQTFLNATLYSLRHPNMAMDARVTNQYLFTAAIKAAVARLIRGTTPAAVQRQAVQEFSSIINSTDPVALWTGYWAGLNINKAYPYPSPPPGRSREAQPSGSGGGSDGLSSPAVIAIAVSCSVGGLLIVIGLMVVLVRVRSASWIYSGPPKCSPTTTIVVTDIESSTLLWESVPPEPMNRSVELHHAVVRQVLRQFGGYESATEGDSFILSFHEPWEALSFAIVFERALMKVAWPKELLASPLAASVWVKRSSARAQQPVQPSVTALGGTTIAGLLKGRRSAASIAASASSISVPSPMGAAPNGRPAEPLSPPALPAIEGSYADKSTSPMLVDPLLSRRTEDGPQLSVPSNNAMWPKPSVTQQSSATGAMSMLHFFASQWQRCDVPTDKGDCGGDIVCVTTGLRVRVGLHTGIKDPADAVLNKTTGRMQYGGQPLALAKAVADCGHGGMILLSQAAFEALPAAKLPDAPAMLVNMGDFTFVKDYDLPPTTIFQAVLPGLEARMTTYQKRQLRGTQQLALGALHAPVGHVAVVFSNLVGAATLLAWNRELAEQAIATYQAMACDLLFETCDLLDDDSSSAQSHGGEDAIGSLLCATEAPLATGTGSGGAELPVVPEPTTAASLASFAGARHAKPRDTAYLVELAGGLCLATFTSPADAIRWSLTLAAEMKKATWPAELLRHELCEEVVIGTTNDAAFDSFSPAVDEDTTPAARVPSGQMSLHDAPATTRRRLQGTRLQVLFRGPRLKAGVDLGHVHATVNPVTGRMTYRGRVMNRAARVAQSAGSGQVWATETAWFAAQEPLEKVGSGVHANYLGVFTLKGVMDPVPLVHCTEPVITAVHKAGPGGAAKRTETENGSLAGTQSSFAGEDGARPSRSRFRAGSSATLTNHHDALLHSAAQSYRTGTAESTAPHMLIATHTEDAAGWMAGGTHHTHDAAAAVAAPEPNVGASARLPAIADSGHAAGGAGDRRSSVAAVVHMASPGGMAAAGALVFSPRRTSRASYPARASPSSAAAAADVPCAAAAAQQQEQLHPPQDQALAQGAAGPIKLGAPAKAEGPESMADGEIHAWLPPPPDLPAAMHPPVAGTAWESTQPSGTGSATGLQLYGSPSGTMLFPAQGNGASSHHNLLQALQQRATSIATTAPSSRAGGPQQPALAINDVMVAALAPPSQAAVPGSLVADAATAAAHAPLVVPAPPSAPASPAPASLQRRKTQAEGAPTQPASEKRPSDSHRVPPPLTKTGRETMHHVAPAARPSLAPAPAPPHRGGGHGRGPSTQPMPGAGISSGVVWGLHSQCDGVGELLGFAGLPNPQVASLLAGDGTAGSPTAGKSRPHNSFAPRAPVVGVAGSALSPIRQSLDEGPPDGGAARGERLHGKAGRWGEVLRKTLQLHRRRPGAGTTSVDGPGGAVAAATATAAAGSHQRLPASAGAARDGGAGVWDEQDAPQGAAEALATFNGLRVT